MPPKIEAIGVKVDSPPPSIPKEAAPKKIAVIEKKAEIHATQIVAPKTVAVPKAVAASQVKKVEAPKIVSQKAVVV